MRTVAISAVLSRAAIRLLNTWADTFTRQAGGRAGKAAFLQCQWNLALADMCENEDIPPRAPPVGERIPPFLLKINIQSLGRMNLSRSPSGSKCFGNLGVGGECQLVQRGCSVNEEILFPLEPIT